MLVFVPRESVAGETRVAATAASVPRLLKLGYDVVVESGCGASACQPDSVYSAAGARVVEAGDVALTWTQADIVLKVLAPSPEEVRRMKEGATVVSFLWPATHSDLVRLLAERRIEALAMDCVPRISRAQKLDALSSMANIAGYRAVIEAAGVFGSFFTGQITAAGKVPPARVLVIGAGVAGLAAIGAARGLGAVVRAFDTRLAAAEQVRSLGAEFLELDFAEDGDGAGGYAKTMSPEFIRAEMELFAKQAREVDIVITTALIPGRPAPKLITAEMVRSMKTGSVIVDMAAEQGGNCELTRPGEKSCQHGVTILGYTDLAGRMASQSSALYSSNVANLLSDMTPEKNGQLTFNLDDEVVRGTLVTHAGAVIWPAPAKPAPDAGRPAATSIPAGSPAVPRQPAWYSGLVLPGLLVLLGILLLLVGQNAPPDFVSRLTVFVLACFVGWQVIWNVTPALHTPLMSVTNAISGIIVIGGLLQVDRPWYSASSLLAAVAILVATINIAGGFWVTHRMLGMFRKQG